MGLPYRVLHQTCTRAHVFQWHCRPTFITSFRFAASILFWPSRFEELHRAVNSATFSVLDLLRQPTDNVSFNWTWQERRIYTASNPFLRLLLGHPESGSYGCTVRATVHKMQISSPYNEPLSQPLYGPAWKRWVVVRWLRANVVDATIATFRR